MKRFSNDTMSSYVNYSQEASTYDLLRHPDGADVEIAMVQLYCNKPLKDLHVLDAGCGTGNFTKAFLEHGTGSVTLLDASVSMLDQAKAKLDKEIAAGKVKSVIQAELPEIPLKDGTVDAVILNFVLNHLSTNPDGTTFSEMEQTLAESRRVLAPGGVIVIMTVLPSTITKSLWFSHLNGKMTEKNAKRHPTLLQFEEMLQKCNFQCLDSMNVHMKDMRSSYFTAEGPLNKDWRDYTVIFNDANEEELDDVLDKVRKMKDDGTLQGFMESNDKILETGIFTVIFARAPST